MSTWKSARGASATAAERRPAAIDDGARADRADAMAVTALELEVDPEVGCDPYNSTGQFLAEALRRRLED